MKPWFGIDHVIVGYEVFGELYFLPLEFNPELEYKYE